VALTPCQPNEVWPCADTRGEDLGLEQRIQGELGFRGCLEGVEFVAFSDFARDAENVILGGGEQFLCTTAVVK